MNPIEFQTDLQNGMSLHDALCKHDVTLDEAFKTFYNRQYRKRDSNYWGENINRTETGEKYITKNQGMFLVRKTINRKMVYFGRYSTLEDAILVRDYFIEHGWNRHLLNSVRKTLGV